MKKIFGIVFAAALAMPMLAETKAGADNSDWLPKAGDWNIQIGMDPKAIVMGGTWSTVGGFAAGYMVTDNIGIRATLGLNAEIWNHRDYAPDQAALALNEFSKEKVIDTQKRTSVGGSFSLGADYHVGSAAKVQGIFGAGLVYGFKGIDKFEYSYGNAITEYNQKPMTALTDAEGNSVWSKFGTEAIETEPESAPKNASGIEFGRILKENRAGEDVPRQMVGLYLSAGIEWFVTPKLALGLNADMTFRYQFMQAYTTTYEGWDQFKHERVEWVESEKPMENGFEFKMADAVGLKMYMSVYL